MIPAIVDPVAGLALKGLGALGGFVLMVQVFKLETKIAQAIPTKVVIAGVALLVAFAFGFVPI